LCRLALLLWLGWAYLTKTVRKPQRGGVNFDPPMVFVLILCKMLQLLPKCSRATFAQNKKFCPQKRIFGAWAGYGEVTFLYKNLRAGLAMDCSGLELKRRQI
jgi:hypothetical protein